MTKNNDKFQKVQIFFRFLFEVYKIFTSCLLVVLVPQKCDDGTRMCSFADNFNDLDPYNTFALYFNITTSIVFFLYFTLELYRERIYIQLLDIDYEKDEDNYYDEVKTYPKIKSKINDINFIFYYFNIFLIVIFFINIIISLIVITNFYLNDLTIFITITNTILILDKLLRSFFIAKKSFYQRKAFSMYTRKDVSYNCVDRRIKRRRRRKKKKRRKKQNIEINMDN